ncbi:hypothetical protein DPMN_090498 [Dreissena polymorpha]|uniref:Uncharacterized protein n=1 Tax=Dreissena polymorpha TaxID=45954 RepID=A0A9D4KYQ8_DREPO|nr:hypothetical protein DPMN_090498 [Dreissena polymorpha]
MTINVCNARTAVVLSNGNCMLHSTGNRFEGERVWISSIILKEGMQVWESNQKPVHLDQNKVFLTNH